MARKSRRTTRTVRLHGGEYHGRVLQLSIGATTASFPLPDTDDREVYACSPNTPNGFVTMKHIGTVNRAGEQIAGPDDDAVLS
jgi:hypothetical protein